MSKRNYIFFHSPDSAIIQMAAFTNYRYDVLEFNKHYDFKQSMRFTCSIIPFTPLKFLSLQFVYTFHMRFNY